MQNTNLERIIRPIVEGQIEDFLIAHPEVLEGVYRHKAFAGKTQKEWVKNSLAKRIVRDLTCEATIARLEQAVLEAQTEALAD